MYFRVECLRGRRPRNASRLIRSGLRTGPLLLEKVPARRWQRKRGAAQAAAGVGCAARLVFIKVQTSRCETLEAASRRPVDDSSAAADPAEASEVILFSSGVLTTD